MSDKLFGLSVPPSRARLKAEIKKDVLEQLEELVAFAKETDGSDVKIGHVVEHIIELYLSSYKKEVKEFRKWKEGKNSSEEPPEELSKEASIKPSKKNKNVLEGPTNSTASKNSVAKAGGTQKRTIAR